MDNIIVIFLIFSIFLNDIWGRRLWKTLWDQHFLLFSKVFRLSILRTVLFLFSNHLELQPVQNLAIGQWVKPKCFPLPILTDWLNGLKRHFPHYISHIRATAHIIMQVFSFTSSRLGIWDVLPRDSPEKNPVLPMKLESRPSMFLVLHYTT